MFRALIAIFIWAAQKLPAIPGLEITGSRVKSLPPEQRRRAEKTSKVSSVKVEIDIKAAGRKGRTSSSAPVRPEAPCS